jgi:hypothetical protein
VCIRVHPWSNLNQRKENENMTKQLLRMTWLVLLAVMAGGVAQAQNYAADWFTIDGGGGASAGGGYSVTGTIGQPDAGTMSGGRFSVEGGFWGGVEPFAVPQLFIRRSGPNILLSWSPAVPGFVLQASDSLGSADWTNIPTGGMNPVSVPINGERRFYRLATP